MSELACEICGKAPGKADLWTLCQDCFEFLSTLLEFVKQHDVDVKDLEPLKQALRLQAKEIGLA